MSILCEQSNNMLAESRMSGFREAAVDTASKSCHKYHKHGALLIKNGQIISIGFNDHKNHAEQNAIKNGYRVLRGSEERKDV